MSILVTCSNCNTSFRALAEDAGKQGKCPQCQAVIQVPEPAGPPPEKSVPPPEKSVPAPEKPAERPAQPAAAAGPSLPTAADAPPFQYSLQTLLIVMTAVAVACSLLFAGPDWLKILSSFFLVVTLAAVLIVVLVYGRGYSRTFCIGAIFPAGLAMLYGSILALAGFPYLLYGSMGPGGRGLSEVGQGVAIGAGILLGEFLALGLLACAVRSMVEGPRRRVQQQQQREARRLAAVPYLRSQPDHDMALGPVVPLVVCIGFCILLAMMLYGPDWGKIAAGICIVLALPVVLTTMLVYARAYLRTFCIGALFPAGASLLTYQFSFYFMGRPYGPRSSGDEGLLFLIATAIIWGMTLAVGLIACGVRWMIEDPGRQQREAAPHQQDPPADGPWESPPRSP